MGEEILVNSKHHQSVDCLGEGLTIIAQSQDGVIEAIENKEHKILGVQWHPEKMLTKNGKQVFEVFKTLL